jgi:hypothetical protein
MSKEFATPIIPTDSENSKEIKKYGEAKIINNLKAEVYWDYHYKNYTISISIFPAKGSEDPIEINNVSFKSDNAKKAFDFTTELMESESDSYSIYQKVKQFLKTLPDDYDAKLENDDAITESIDRVKLEEIESLLDKAVDNFDEAKPEFWKVRQYISEIEKEVKAFQDDFNILLHEEKKYGGGIEGNEGRIKSMRRAVPSFKAMVEATEGVINSDEVLFGPYKKQIESARRMLVILEKI